MTTAASVWVQAVSGLGSPSPRPPDGPQKAYKSAYIVWGQMSVLEEGLHCTQWREIREGLFLTTFLEGEFLFCFAFPCGLALTIRFTR